MAHTVPARQYGLPPDFSTTKLLLLSSILPTPRGSASPGCFLDWAWLIPFDVRNSCAVDDRRMHGGAGPRLCRRRYRDLDSDIGPTQTVQSPESRPPFRARIPRPTSPLACLRRSRS